MTPDFDADGDADPIEQFRCEVSYFDERAAVVVRGAVDRDGADELLRLMRKGLTFPIRRMTVDLSRVTELGDPGVDALLDAFATAKLLGVEFQLISVPLPIIEALDPTHAAYRRR